MAVLESRATCDEEKKATVAILPGEFGAAAYALWDGYGLVVRANDRPVPLLNDWRGRLVNLQRCMTLRWAELLF